MSRKGVIFGLKFVSRVKRTEIADCLGGLRDVIGHQLHRNLGDFALKSAIFRALGPPKAHP